MKRAFCLNVAVWRSSCTSNHLLLRIQSGYFSRGSGERYSDHTGESRGFMIANCFIGERQQWTTSETVHGVYSHHTKLQGKGNNPLYKFVYLTAFSQQKICPWNKKQNTNNHHELQNSSLLNRLLYRKPCSVTQQTTQGRDSECKAKLLHSLLSMGHFKMWVSFCYHSLLTRSV